MLNFYRLRVLNIFLLTSFCILTFTTDIYGISNVNDVSKIGIDEKLEESIGLQLGFTDQNGETVTLGDYFDSRPVVINMMYLSCPRVCTFALDGVLEVVNETGDLNIGKDYQVLSISFNPEEDNVLAKKRSAKYLDGIRVDEEDQGAGWVFLTGGEENILELTGELGYKFMEDGDEYAHPSALIVLTPEGKISRYLYGIQHNSKDYKLALIEAADGKIGDNSLSNKVLLFCYQFDPVGKRYALKALNIVKAGGVVTLLALSGFLAFFWIRENRSK